MFLAWALLALTFTASAAIAEKRVALLIGNGAYTRVTRLPNPANDANAMATLFRNAGFDIVEAKRDLSLPAMRRAFRDFSDQVRDADIAVVFFAGHGMEINGVNHVIPVDAVLERDVDVEDETISLERVSQLIEPARRLRLIILDACRDNPFTRSMKQTIATRSIGRGLARVDVLAPDTMIAFAAKAGSVASDGAGPNSPYTTALLKHVAAPGLDVRLALGRVRDDVVQNTAGKQEPFVYGSLGGAEIALRPSAPAPPPINADLLAWAKIRLSNDVGELKKFLEEYPSSLLVPDARQRLDLVERQLRERAEREKAEREKAERERLDRERIARDQQAQREREKAEQDRIARERLERDQREQKAREQAETDRLERERIARVQQERQQAQQSESGESQSNTQTAMLPPTSEPKASATYSPTPLVGEQLAREIKKELKRAGCYGGPIDKEWSPATKTSIQNFAKYAKLPSGPAEPHIDLLNAIRGKTGRVCPLECNSRQMEKDGQCIAKTCPSGLTLGRDGVCEKPKEQEKAGSAEKGDRSKASGSPGNAALGDPLREAEHIWPTGTLRTGQTVTATARNGRKITCTAGNLGPNFVPRKCFWN